ncbi:MAG: nicotinate-nucleotide adenylyltransferase [Bacteroidetes bacterium]|nr:nicotinate-nucleotide adenylyltransferase [Bacteroidota bacterium]MCY4205761.1 nicotinate-nucleotide adenylyltransferase [Bacteroidota bacterium]
MKVGIFGGSFDPPHVAHSIIAETVRFQYGLDLILWVPAYDPPHKFMDQLAPFETRLALVRAATRDHPAFEVSDIEKTLKRPTYTIRMLHALAKQYPGAELHLILGSDTVDQFCTWSEPEAILQVSQILVYPRPGYSVENMNLPEYLHGKYSLVNAPVFSISAEYIRNRLLEEKTVRYLVLENVLDYIREHRLYKG